MPHASYEPPTGENAPNDNQYTAHMAPEPQYRNFQTSQKPNASYQKAREPGPSIQSVGENTPQLQPNTTTHRRTRRTITRVNTRLTTKIFLRTTTRHLLTILHNKLQKVYTTCDTEHVKQYRHETCQEVKPSLQGSSCIRPHRQPLTHKQKPTIIKP